MSEYVDKPELQSHTLFTASNRGDARMNESHTISSGLAELPQQTMTLECSDLTRVAELPCRSQVDDRNPAEMDSTTPRAGPVGAGFASHTTNKDSFPRDDQPREPFAVELPVVPTSVDSSAVKAVENPNSVPIRQPLQPPSALSSQGESRDVDLEALRRHEKDLVESISAAERLEKLKKEHREVQERIRVTEAGRMDESTGR